MKSITIRGKRKRVYKVHSHSGRWSAGRVHYVIAGRDPLWGRCDIPLCGTSIQSGARRVADHVNVTCQKCAALDKENHE